MRGDTRRETCRKNSLPLRRVRNLKVLSHMEAVLGVSCLHSGDEASSLSDFQLLEGFRAVGSGSVFFQEQGTPVSLLPWGWADFHTVPVSLPGLDSLPPNEGVISGPETADVQGFTMPLWQMSAIPSCLALLRWRALAAWSRGSQSQKRQRANICTTLYSWLFTAFHNHYAKLSCFLAKSQQAPGHICLMEILMPTQGTWWLPCDPSTWDKQMPC